jgi:NAD(P)-dependent dehydrogenase (short-subunit alcohol dehydrogenase family)
MSALASPQAHALITGAGSGIGAAIAQVLAQQGARLSLAGRSLDKLQAQAERLRRHVPEAVVVLAPMDISSADSVETSVVAAQTQLGPVNILVNNAGQAHSQPFVRTDAALWQQMLDVNLSGTFHVTRAVLPGMLDAASASGGGTPGRIINIASTAGLMGYAYVSAYVAAKHGVVGLTKALALELARKNITVNALCPGYTETEIVQEAVRNIVAKTGQSEDQARLALAARNPQQRLVQPAEVAQSVVWLCAPGSEAINGQAIAIDGGEQAG